MAVVALAGRCEDACVFTGDAFSFVEWRLKDEEG
jgi:hypothetical protein